jgi:hypothetical protein
MMLVLVAIALPTLFVAMKFTQSPWILTILTLIMSGVWVVFTNYLSWRLIPWVPAPPKQSM